MQLGVQTSAMAGVYYKYWKNTTASEGNEGNRKFEGPKNKSFTISIQHLTKYVTNLVALTAPPTPLLKTVKDIALKCSRNEKKTIKKIT